MVLDELARTAPDEQRAKLAEITLRRQEAERVRKGLVKTTTGPNKVTDKLSATRSYASKAAADLGVDERTVRRDLSRGKNITPEIRAEVIGTGLG